MNILTWIYYALKAVGLFDKLLAIHKEHEAQNAQTRDIRLSDDDAVKRLYSEYESRN